MFDSPLFHTPACGQPDVLREPRFTFGLPLAESVRALAVTGCAVALILADAAPF